MSDCLCSNASVGFHAPDCPVHEPPSVDFECREYYGYSCGGVIELRNEVDKWRKMVEDADQEGDDWHAKAINLARANGRKEREIRELKARLHVVEAERDALIIRPYDG